MTEPTPSEPSLASWMREARERLDAATPGPWAADLSEIHAEANRGRKGMPWSSDGTGIADVALYPADASFIAHAPEDLRRALDVLERVEALCDERERHVDERRRLGIYMGVTSEPITVTLARVRAALSGRPAQ